MGVDANLILVGGADELELAVSALFPYTRLFLYPSAYIQILYVNNDLYSTTLFKKNRQFSKFLRIEVIPSRFLEYPRSPPLGDARQTISPMLQSAHFPYSMLLVLPRLHAPVSSPPYLEG